jgi:ATP-dependent helicase/nuclease subunit A
VSARGPAPDERHREAAVAARGVNVLVDAGAGTGKTTLLVRRLIEMVAPAEDAREAVPLSRIAAVTFTRKAAGELKLRVRERLLAELAGPVSTVRRNRLAGALAQADTAFIGTIHGFADRLLRTRPVEAGLSPSYQVVEDAGPLCREAFELLLQASEAGRLDEELGGTGCGQARAREAQEYLRAALRAELPLETRETPWQQRYGLDALFEGFILHRDVPPAEAEPAPFQPEEVQRPVEAMRSLASASEGPGRGSRRMAEVSDRLRRMAALRDPVDLHREAARLLRLMARGGPLQKKRDFPGDPDGWEAWKAWMGDRKKGVEGLRDLLTRPLRRWMATRLVRCFPAVVAMYGKVKARRRAVDQVDLLLGLRDLLKRDPAVRRDMQRRFDHVFVDEFQDTDPLQAEIVLFLCEASQRARDWREVKLAPGTLTLVGDPKQSIYRFRRADIGVYQAVRDLVTSGPHLAVPLTASFRSEPALIDHLNDRFDAILGTAAAGTAGFDATAGTVANQRLDKGRSGRRAACVVALPFSTEAGTAESDRLLEARVLATWIRRTVDQGTEAVVDPVTEERRPMRFGDVAVLAHSTWNVGMLVDELDRLGVPWSARGGTLFLDDPLHRQFLLGLRAVADAGDGVAAAALLRAPFFSVDLRDLVGERAAGEGTGDQGVARARAALALVAELRKDRLARPPGETARDLLERTGMARAAAFGPNGRQRLDRLREICFELERMAAAEGLDYDGATARLREWAREPVALDPPRPLGGEAVEIVTIHQAKGLEFPVVAWWDARATLAPREVPVPWVVERTGSAWAVRLDGLAWEEPEASGFLARELAWHAAERRRLVYVAATRARDLLVLPRAGQGDGARVTEALAGDGSSPALSAQDPWADQAPAWARGVEPPPARRPEVAGALASETDRAWAEAAAEAGRARLAPRGVATEAWRVAEGEAEGEAGDRAKEREGRFGRAFGDTVHLAIGAVLREPSRTPAEAARLAARQAGLDHHLAEAAEDVARALRALEAEGLRRAPGPDLRLEYPVAAAREGTLLVGYLDLVARRGEETVVVDFKSDAPPRGEVAASYPAYLEQVRSYGRILVELGLAREGAVRCGLLYTADGVVRWG